MLRMSAAQAGREQNLDLDIIAEQEGDETGNRDQNSLNDMDEGNTNEHDDDGSRINRPNSTIDHRRKSMMSVNTEANFASDHSSEEYENDEDKPWVNKIAKRHTVEDWLSLLPEEVKQQMLLQADRSPTLVVRGTDSTMRM